MKWDELLLFCHIAVLAISLQQKEEELQTLGVQWVTIPQVRLPYLSVQLQMELKRL